MNYSESNNRGYNSNGHGAMIPDNEPYEDGQEIDIFKLLSILYLNKWTFISIVSVVTIVTIIWSLTIMPIYKSSGTMLITENKNRFSYAGSDLANLLTTSYGIGAGSSIANELQILKSRQLSEDVATQIANISFDENGRKFPILWRAYPTDSTTTSIDTVAARFRGNITFEQPDREADFIEISFESPLPTEAAAVINVTMDTYADLSTNQHRSMAVSALRFLNDEQVNLKNNLNAAEDSLQKFMNRTSLVSIDTQSKELIANLSQLSIERQKLEVSLVAVTSAVEQYEKQLEEIKPGLADQYSDAMGPLMERMQYQLAELETERLQLLTKNPDISPTNPDLVRLNKAVEKVKSEIRDRTSKLVESGSDLYLSFMGRNENSVTNRISDITQKLIELKVEQTQFETQNEVINRRYNEINDRFENLPDNMISLARLERDVRINEEMYMLVSSQQAEMSLWEKTQFGLGRPLDYAISAKNPVKPRKRIIVMAGFMLGCFLAVGVVLVRERLNDNISSAEDLKGFGVPALGAIPDFNVVGDLNPAEFTEVGNTKISNQLVTVLDHISPISEAYRRLRINILYANPDKKYKVLMVSSAAKSEGKSTAAANLAITLAGNERKVLIIDLDLRRPTMHKVFGVTREPGLTELVFGTSNKSDVIRNTIAPNVDLMTVGMKTPEPAVVLDSSRLKQLVEDLSHEYDHIILDTAPYGIISDSASLLRLVDGIVIVARFNSTTKRELNFTIDGLKRLNADVVGIALNAFNPKRSTDYYSNYNYYQRTYSEYYRYKEEDA